jgi:hypothetical protein
MKLSPGGNRAGGRRYKTLQNRGLPKHRGKARQAGSRHPVQPASPAGDPKQKEDLMKLVLASAALAALLGLASISEANAWGRSGSFTTRRGTYYGSASGGCAGGTCSRSVSVTGPNGGTVSRSGGISRVGPHAYDYSRTTTGANGNSVTRSGTVVAYPAYGYRY